MTESGFAQDLKTALEKAVGFELLPLKRLDGTLTLNFKAVRASDGFAFAVKCSPPERHGSFESLARNFEALDGAKTARRIFPEALRKFGDYDVLCLSWCEGVRLFPDRLTDAQMESLVDDYLDFSAALQHARPSCPPDDCAAARRKALAGCRSRWSAGIRRMLECELTESAVTLRPGLTRLIHGDLHHGNFLFRDGRVSGFFDFENITRGYPAEDMIRYFVCASEHLRWYEQHRKRRILRLFRIVVRRMPYGLAEWNAALDRLLVSKIARKVSDSGLGLLMSANLLFRARYYRAMKRIAAEELSASGVGESTEGGNAPGT